MTTHQSAIPDLFDEAGYLRLYPDIAGAVAARKEQNAWLHYAKHGRQEGRRPNDVDPEFYLRAYPQAAEDIAAGRAPNAAAHYVLFGRGRGYRPRETAPRTELQVPFGCLWTDLPHALDMIAGRQELGTLSARQAELLRGWLRDGFVVLDGPADPRLVAAAALDLERSFAGACPDMLFSCGAVALEPVHWQPEINPYPAAALDIHFMSHAVRSLMLSDPVSEFLGLVFDARLWLAASRGSLREAQPAGQRDSATAGYSLPGQFATAWIALEEADPVQVFPGSHRLPAMYRNRLLDRMREHGVDPVPFQGGRGRILIRHPALVHAAPAVPDGSTRRGFLAQFCPRHVTPLYAERHPARVWRFGPHIVSSGIYPNLEPLD